MRFVTRYYSIATLLAISVFLETLAYTYMQQQGDKYYYSSSIIYFLAGLAICILPLLPHYGLSYKNPKTNKLVSYLFVPFLAGLLVYHIILLASLYRVWHIDNRIADMIPTIQEACKRFLSGVTVYGPAPEIKPQGINYFPMMWIPFLPAEIFGFDARWITLAAVFIGLFIALSPMINKPVPVVPALITGIALFLFFNYFLMKYIGFWAMVEEPVVAGFYLLLGVALFRNNYWLIGFAITCCMLSRFSLLFWVPVYLGYVFLTHNKNDFWKLFLSLIISMLLLFILPFFIWNPVFFLKIPSGYGGIYQSWFWDMYHLNEHLFYCVGFYKFFNASQVKLMFELETILSLLAPAGFLYLISRWQKKFGLNIHYAAFCSLKLSLIFFYGFLQTVYPYLFFVPTIISYAIVFDYLSPEKLNEESLRDN